jgi:hypothetical protein
LIKKHNVEIYLCKVRSLREDQGEHIMWAELLVASLPH